MPMDIEEFRRAGYAAIDRICDYYANIERRPVVAQVNPGWLIRALPREPPQEGESMEDIANDFQNYILPGITHWQHPSFFAYFPSTATFAGILGDLYASSVTNPGFNWLSSPACTELEQVVMDWSASLLGLDKVFHISSGIGGGAIQGTASDSALLAAIAARIRFKKAHPDVSTDKLILYISSQTHSLGVKSAMLLGVRHRILPVWHEDGYALRGEVLRKAYKEDRSSGKWPFCLMATVGTTSSGAVDRLDEIGPLMKGFQHMWLHVDSAWAGVSFACPEYREAGRLQDINAHADSFCTNFHKWGLVNFDASTFWVRDRTNLTEALEITPSFLKTKQGDAGTVIDYRNWQVALGRRFRSIKFWFVLRNYGVDGFQAHIRKGVQLGTEFEAMINASPYFQLVTPRSLALVVFRLIPPGKRELPSDMVLNALNLEFHQLLTDNASSSEGVFVTRTDLNGKLCIRMAIGGERTQLEHVKDAFTTMVRRAKDVMIKYDEYPSLFFGTRMV